MERWNCIYLHGQLEDIEDSILLDMDQICFESNVILKKDDKTGIKYPKDEMIYDIVICLKDGKFHECYLYFWYAKISGKVIPRGLVVAKDDEYGNIYAKERFDAKTVCL